MNKQIKAIPEFANEQEERLFWEQNDSTNYVDWNKASPVVLPNLKPTTKTISLRLPQHLLDSIKAAARSMNGAQGRPAPAHPCAPRHMVYTLEHLGRTESPASKSDKFSW
jgi:predicted DNA binding CopG/RHH family protein